MVCGSQTGRSNKLQIHPMVVYPRLRMDSAWEAPLCVANYPPHTLSPRLEMYPLTITLTSLLTEASHLKSLRKRHPPFPINPRYSLPDSMNAIDLLYWNCLMTEWMQSLRGLQREVMQMPLQSERITPSLHAAAYTITKSQFCRKAVKGRYPLMFLLIPDLSG